MLWRIKRRKGFPSHLLSLVQERVFHARLKFWLKAQSLRGQIWPGVQETGKANRACLDFGQCNITHEKGRESLRFYEGRNRGRKEDAFYLYGIRATKTCVGWSVAEAEAEGGENGKVLQHWRGNRGPSCLSLRNTSCFNTRLNFLLSSLLLDFQMKDAHGREFTVKCVEIARLLYFARLAYL